MNEQLIRLDKYNHVNDYKLNPKRKSLRENQMKYKIFATDVSGIHDANVFLKANNVEYVDVTNGLIIVRYEAEK